MPIEQPEPEVKGRKRRSPGGKDVKAPLQISADPDAARYRLKLYVAGQTPKSIRAVANLTRFCEKYLSGRYEIQVIDLLVHPQLASGDQIIAVPTLVRKLPLPIRKIIGDLSDETRMLVGLDMQEV